MKKCKRIVLGLWLCSTKGDSHTDCRAHLSSFGHQRDLGQVSATSLIIKFLYDNGIS